MPGSKAWGFPGTILFSLCLQSKTQPLNQDPTPLRQLSTFRLRAGKAPVTCKLTPA